MTDHTSNILSSKPPSLFNSSPYHKNQPNKENQLPSGRRSSHGSTSISEDILKAKIQNLTNTMSQRRGSTPFAHEMSFNPENTLKNSRNESPEPLREKSDNITHSDVKLLHKEIATLKKALNESQARSVVATKDLAKIQYENAALQLQAKKADAKCKDLIDKHATNQVRINELAFINSQLNNEIVKLKTSAHESSHETKEDMNRLRKALVQIEDTIEDKNNKVAKYSREAQKVLDTFQDLLVAANIGIYNKFEASFVQGKRFIQKILKVVESRKVEDFETTQEENMREYDAIKSLNQVISAYEKENGELIKEIKRLEIAMEKEKAESYKMPMKYKDSLFKLKDAVNVVKTKLKEMQVNKQVEKEYYEGKIQKLKEAKDRSVQENKSLKAQNEMLEAKLRDGEYEIKTLKEKMENANFKHQQGIRAHWSKASNIQEKKNEPEFTQNRKNSYQQVDAPFAKEASVGSKMYIGGYPEHNLRSARGYSVDRQRFDAESSHLKPKTLNFGCQQTPSAKEDKANPLRSWRGQREEETLNPNRQENSDKFEMGDELKGEYEVEGNGYVKEGDRGLRTEIFLLDDEISKLEECIRCQLATNEDFAF